MKKSFFITLLLALFMVISMNTFASEHPVDIDLDQPAIEQVLDIEQTPETFEISSEETINIQEDMSKTNNYMFVFIPPGTQENLKLKTYSEIPVFITLLYPGNNTSNNIHMIRYLC